MEEKKQSPMSTSQLLSMVICTILLIVYVTLVTWVLYKLNFDWLTMSWVQQNLEWLVGFLIVGIIVLFFFPLLLGWQLNKEEEKND